MTEDVRDLPVSGKAEAEERIMGRQVEYLARWTPDGSQTASKAPGRAGPVGGGYPSVLSHGYGAHVVDVCGRTFTDYVCGLACVGLGHAHPAVTAAVERQLTRGTTLSLPTRLEGEAAEQLCAVTGWAEQARFVKTGSEANEGAVRIARLATQRDKVLTVRQGYHAWHAWFQAVKPEHPGVPWQMTKLIGGLDYGWSASWDDELATNGYAAVILEPAPIIGGGDAAFLRRLVDEARAHGTLVIFDEVVWGFRLSRAGGTAYFGVEPDLATYGKAMANGLPIGAIVGRRDLMRHAGLVSGTFGGDTLALAAALATMHVYEQEPVIEAMWERGTQLVEGFNAMKGSVMLIGYPVHPVPYAPHWSDGDPVRVEVLSLLLQELAARGVLWHPSGLNLMYAHQRAHVDRTLEAARGALEVLEGHVSAGTVRQALRGKPYQPAFARRTT